MSKQIFHIEDKHYTVEQHEGRISVDGKMYDVNLHKMMENEFSILIGGKSYHIFFNSCSKCFCARIDNHVYEIKHHSLRDQLAERFLQKADDHTKAQTYRAPMPGLITKIIKRNEDQVHEGDGILVVEAMKMENEIRSTKSGIVKKIFVQEKQAVEKGDPLFIIE